MKSKVALKHFLNPLHDAVKRGWPLLSARSQGRAAQAHPKIRRLNEVQLLQLPGGNFQFSVLYNYIHWFGACRIP